MKFMPKPHQDLCLDVLREKPRAGDLIAPKVVERYLRKRVKEAVDDMLEEIL